MLNDQERQTLSEIERHLRDEDPRLAHTLENSAQARTGRSLGWSALILAAGLLGALMLTLGQPSAALTFALVAGWAWGTLTRRFGPRNRP